VRCPRCGNENPGTNRFCGMCGATLLQEPAPAAKPVAVESPRAAQAPVVKAEPAPQPPPSPAQTRIESPPSTSISGPSFLGLNDPPPHDTSKRGSLSIDPDRSSSGNLDYLLDDEEPKTGGGGKWLLILAVLAIAAGLGYWRWKNGSFPTLLGSTKKPEAAQTESAPDNSGPPAPGSKSATPASTDSATHPAAPETGNSTPTASQPATQPAIQPPATTSAGSDAAQAHPAPPDTRNSDDASDDAPVPAAKTKPEPVKPSAVKPANKPAPTPQPARPAGGDSIAEAQRYLYGKGVRQDCDRGLKLLKPAAEKANPKAMIEMGALYSAGLCTPRDLPTAYRWFAMALHKDPENQAVQTDLQKLWSEMTQPERQLAIRLSQ